MWRALVARPNRQRPLSRAASKKAVRKDILVLVEGERTEEDYLVHWHRAHRMRVNVTIHPFHGGPRQLIDRAVQEKRKGERDQRRGRGRGYDEVWCCFDVDEHPFLNEVKQIAESNGIRLAVSNPCIELWFLLHYENQTAYLERWDAQSRASNHLGCGKALTPSALAKLEERLAIATERAQALDVKHEGDGSPAGHNPSSSVWLLVQSIST